MPLKETNRKEQKAITIGSGTAYLVEFDGNVPEFNTRADLDALCIEDNRLGYTKGGATVAYNKETGQISDDLGYLTKTYIQSNTASLKLGLFAWNGNTLAKVESTARVEDKDGIRVTKIGGLGNDNGKQHMLVFLHEDKQDGDCWWVLVGKNTAGLELAYASDEGTKVEPEFTANSMDKDGTLLIYIEEIGRTDDTAGTGGAEGDETQNAG